MNTIGMEDVPREVWDEVYAKWQRALNIGWRESMWTGCSLCVWMARELDVRRMRDVDCEACPLYEGEWCRSVPEDSKIHTEYAENGFVYDDDWNERVHEFLEFIKPYCSKDGDSDIRGDILEYIRANGGMYDMVGVSMRFSSLSTETVYATIDTLMEEGMVEKGFDDMNIYSLRVTEDGENADNRSFEEEDKKMDKEKGKIAILELRKAIKAVQECGADSERRIVGDLFSHISELQNEIGGYEHEINTGRR